MRRTLKKVDRRYKSTSLIVKEFSQILKKLDKRTPKSMDPKLSFLLVAHANRIKFVSDT